MKFLSLIDSNISSHNNFYRFKVDPIINISNFNQLVEVKEKSTINELTSLSCFKCRAKLIKSLSKPFAILPLPDHELDELADNFFCHLHDHNHNVSQCSDQHSDEIKEDMTNILNPLRDKYQIRKSILSNMSVFVLNKYHLDGYDNSFIHEINTNEIKCSQCMFELGYKGIYLMYSSF
jgi:hypothetical protein